MLITANKKTHPKHLKYIQVDTWAMVEAVINGCCTMKQLRRSDLLLVTVLPHCNRWRPLWDLIIINNC